MKKIVLFVTLLIAHSATYSQFRNEKTGKKVSFNQILLCWEKHFETVPEILFWSSNPGQNKVERTEKHAGNFVLPLNGESSFIEIQELVICKGDSTALLSVSEHQSWVKESLNYLHSKKTYDSLGVDYSGLATIYWVPYLTNFYFIEIFAEIHLVNVENDSSSRIETMFIPIRGFTTKMEFNSLDEVFQNLLGGPPPFNLTVSPWVNKNMWSLERIIPAKLN